MPKGGVISRIFSSGIGEATGGISKVIDSLNTTDGEKLKAKEQLTNIVLSSLTKLAEASKEVILSETEGDKLQRHWRPIVMLTFAGIVTLNYAFLPLINVWANSEQLSLFLETFSANDNFWFLLELGIGGYVIGRSLEKVSDKVTRNIDISMIRKKDRAETKE